MGYSPAQIEDLRQSIEATPCELILSATPIDLRRLMSLSTPVMQVSYDIREEPGSPLKKIILQFLAEKGH
jgi:predicted GTPase